jgi:hypothetical protein
MNNCLNNVVSTEVVGAGGGSGPPVDPVYYATFASGANADLPVDLQFGDGNTWSIEWVTRAASATQVNLLGDATNSSTYKIRPKADTGAVTVQPFNNFVDLTPTPTVDKRNIKTKFKVEVDSSGDMLYYIDDTLVDTVDTSLVPNTTFRFKDIGSANFFDLDPFVGDLWEVTAYYQGTLILEVKATATALHDSVEDADLVTTGTITYTEET